MGGGGSIGGPSGGSSGAGEGILGVADQAKRPWSPVDWRPGPNGDTAVDVSDPQMEVPTDTFVGRNNNSRWEAGPHGTNITNLTYGNFVGEGEVKSFRKMIQEGMGEALMDKISQIQGAGMDPGMDLSAFAGKAGGKLFDTFSKHMSPDMRTQVKDGQIPFNEVEALKRLLSVKEVPNLLSSNVEAKLSGDDGQELEDSFLGQLATEAPRGLDIGSIGKALHRDLQGTAKNNLWKGRMNIHKNGVAHGGMGPGSIFADTERGDISIDDFSKANPSFAAAFFEALGSDAGGGPGKGGDGMFAQALEALGKGNDNNSKVFKDNKEKLMKELMKMNKQGRGNLKIDETSFKDALAGGTGYDSEEESMSGGPYRSLMREMGITEDELKMFISMLYNGVGQDLLSATKKKPPQNKSVRFPPINKKRLRPDD